MFKITDGRGFQMTFENGWTISVQFGRGNYCDNRSCSQDYTSPEVGSCLNAEIAAWDANDNWGDFGNDTVMGWTTTNMVAQFIAQVASFPKSEKVENGKRSISMNRRSFPVLPSP